MTFNKRLQVANRTGKKYRLQIENLGARIMLDATGMITTAQGYLQTLINNQVREVSPQLLGIFPSGDYLYAEKLNIAWVGSSDNLYTLLQLNHEFPGTIKTTDGTDYQLSQKTIEGMERTVGFPFAAEANGPGNTYVKPESSTANSGVWEGLEIKVFSTADNPQVGTPTSPNFDGFLQLVNAMRPPGDAPLPGSAVAILKQLYRKAATASASPLEVYSRSISGISSYRLADQGIAGADVVTNPDKGINARWVINQNLYRIYSKANDAIGPYYSGTEILSPAELVNNFFTDFARPIIKAKPLGWRNELAIGFRCLLYMAFDVAPLFSSFGVGYSNVANAVAGGPQFSNKPGTRPVEAFDASMYAGQEYLINNSSVAKIVGAVSLGGPPQETVVDQPSWLQRDSSGQFYSLDPTTAIPGGIYNSTPASGSYQWSGKITRTGTAVVFDPGSTTSDTIAAQIGEANRQGKALTPRTTIGTSTTRLRDLPALANSFLPKTFATYISMGGGLDRVTGSSLSDVIIGPTLAGVPVQQTTGFSGELIVNAGAGNDVVEPGRGGSLVWLGSGNNSLIVGQGDLFGQATLMDFHAPEDKLIVDRSFTATGWNTNTLTISDIEGDQKTLILTGTSSPVWKPRFVR